MGFLENKFNQWLNAQYVTLEDRLDAERVRIENHWADSLKAAWQLLRTPTTPSSITVIGGGTQLIRDYAPGALGDWDGKARMIATGSSLSANTADLDYSIDRVSVLLGDGTTLDDWSNPVSKIDFDLRLSVNDGWFDEMRITGIDIQSDGLSVQLKADLTLAEQDIEARLNTAMDTWKGDLQQAWTLFRNQANTQEAGQVTSNADGTQLTRTDGYGETITITGSSLSTDPSDSTYRIDQFEAVSLSDDGTLETRITVGLTLDVANGVVQQLGLSGIEITSDGLSARIDSELTVLKSDIQQAMAPYQQIATAGGLLALNPTSSNRNESATELTLSYAAGTVPNWTGAAQVILRGEKLGIGDPDFRLDSVDLMLSSTNNWTTPETRVAFVLEHLTLWDGSDIPLTRSITVQSGEINESWVNDAVQSTSILRQDIDSSILDAWRDLLANTEPLSVQTDGTTLTREYAPNTLGDWAGGAKLVITGTGLSTDPLDKAFSVDQMTLLLSAPDTPTDWENPEARLSLSLDLDVLQGEIQQFALLDFADTTAPADGFNLTVNTHFWKDAKVITGVALDATHTTDANGTVTLSNQPQGTVTLTPTKAASTADAGKVDLLDAIAVLKSIVGLTTLDAHQTIAADFDGANGVDLLDAIGILKHVVGLPSATPEWVFVDKTDTTPNPADPISVSVTEDTTTVELTGILRGDVDGSWAG